MGNWIDQCDGCSSRTKIDKQAIMNFDELLAAAWELGGQYQREGGAKGGGKKGKKKGGTHT